ncbi:MAG: acetylornithine transaminase [Puniceicoccales bacterium]|nr:acetylornithine transaminase [Puniceicoccales bacterium]
MSATTERYERFLLGNYAPPALTLVRGEGARVWDDTGRRYLDFCSGIAVNALGHAHPRWVAAVREQAASLAHTSNLFRNEKQGLLAERLAARAGAPGRVFFCNSGAEANEALLKLARLHGRAAAGGAEGVKTRVAVAARAFHGRTFGAMSATPQEKIQRGFRPLLDGVDVAELNDLAGFERVVTGATAAVLVEPIQGEGGLAVATPEFLRGLRELCDRHNALLLFDEVQSGAGRAGGTYFAFQRAGVAADGCSLAKGLGGGFPIGAAWVAEKHAALFTPGSHGTTFGGNPLACAAALAVQDAIDADNLLARVEAQSKPWLAALGRVAAAHPALAREARGVGYLAGIALRVETPPVLAALRERGLLAVAAGDNVVRLLPPLTATAAELDESIEIFDRALGALC